MFRFEGLEIWQKSVALGKTMYDLAKSFPKTETFALADQLRRAAVSISNNIAEGSGGTNKDFARFLDVSIKSIFETVNIVYFAHEQGYLTEEERVEVYKNAEILIKQIRALKNVLLKS